jgi:Carboxypeptidase regulatory-like domain
MCKTGRRPADAVSARSVRFAGAVALIVAGSAPATALTLRGRVYTERPGARVTVVAWAQGEALRANPKLADAPLATVQVAGGEAFALEVANAAPPLQIEAMAAGHVGACFALKLPEEAELPPVWLPAGRELRVRVTRDGKAEAGAAAQGYISRSGFGDSGYGFWCPYLTTQRTGADGVLTWWAPGSGSFGVAAVGHDGRWGRVDRALPVEATVEVRLASHRLACKVVDERGEPVGGVEVASAVAPEGTAVVTGVDGTATLQVSGEREGAIVAWGETRAGRALVRPDTAGPVVIKTAPRGTLEVTWTGPARLLLAPGWVPNAIARDGVTWAAGGRARLPWLDGGGVLWAWAPGWTMTGVVVPSVDPPVVLAPAAAVRVEGLVQDSAQHPLAGVPVWAYLPPLRRIGGIGLSADSLGLPFLAWGVSDGGGRFTLPPIPAGFVRLRATRAGFPAAQHGPAASTAGSQVRATLTFRPGTTLAVRVQDPGGAPLPGVTVRAFARDADERPGAWRPDPAALRAREPAAAATTDGDGRAALNALAAGKAWVLLHLAGYVPRVLDTELPAAGGDLGTQVLRPGVSVGGRVVDEAGAALADAEVSAGYGTDGTSAGAGRSDGEGRFAIPDLPREGDVYLLARRQGYFMAAPEKVALPPEGEVVLHLRRARALAGTVVDAESQDPVAEATVYLLGTADRRAGPSTGVVSSPQGVGTSGRTDERGEFRLEGLSPREYSLMVRAPRYQSYQQPVRVPAEGEEQPLTILLKRGLGLHGRVLDAGGQPAPGVQVSAQAAASDAGPIVRMPSSFGAARSGPDGSFAIEGLAPGRHEVRAKGDDGASARTLAEAGAEDVVLRLERSGAVQGRVTGSDGAPASGVKVRLFGSVPFLGDATTDEAGAFDLERVPPGQYYLSAQSRAGSARTQQVKVEPGRTATVEVTLDPTGTVAGTVRGLSPVELEACNVYGGVNSVQPGADGSFRLEGVREGAATVRAAVRGGGRQRTVPVEVKAGETATVEIDFGRGVTIAGTVRRSAGPVAMLVVGATGLGGEGRATTDAAGAFRIESAPTGAVTASVYDRDGRLLVTRQADVQADTTLDLEVPVGEARGWVLAARDRSPIPQATVRIRRDGDAGELRSVSTDSSGAFACGELETGTYRLQATANGFAGADAAVAVGDGAAETTFLLEPDQGVDVTVRSPDGAAPATVYVVLFRGELQESELRLACDGGGRARIAGVPPGGYVGVFMAQGLAVAPVAVPGPAITVQLRESASLAVVTPVTESGAPWRVRATDAQTGFPLPLWVPWPGGLRLGWVEVRGGRASAGVGAGAVVVDAVAPDGGTRRATVTLAPKATETVRFQ